MEKTEQNLVDPTLKKNFNFVDTIRCISMMGIVFEHSATLWGAKYDSVGETILQIASMQFFKFATVAFFLIGGFLINYKFTEYTPGNYIKRRFTNTIKPWLVWILVLVVANFIQNWIVFKRGNNTGLFLNDPITYFSNELKYILFESSFWFILNFLICITILLAFKKYLYKFWFGLVLLLCSLTYSFNLYTEWFVTHHSTALFGFVFYLWLGVFLNRNFEKITQFIKSISWEQMIGLNSVLFVLACAETYLLMTRGSHDEYNTLRITNILYSLSMFGLLLKVGDIKTVDRILTPRQSTFGIYLIHQILIIRLLPELFKGEILAVISSSVYLNIGFSVLRFLIVYGISFSITKFLQKTRFKWIIGN
ncbi:acyltransferase [Pedobacter ginsengiterrae]